jgi:hypothetical protein
MFPPAFAKRWRRKHPKKKSVDQVVRIELEEVVHGVAAITTEIPAHQVEAGEAAIETEAGEALLDLEIAGQAPVGAVAVDLMAAEAMEAAMDMEEATALEVAATVDTGAEAMVVADMDRDGIIVVRTVRSRSFSRRLKTQQGSTSIIMMRSQ